MNKLTRISATVASSLALVAGFSGVASAHSYSGDNSGGNDWGHNRNHDHNNGSNSAQLLFNVQTSSVKNQTDTDVANTNDQNATSGAVSVTGTQNNHDNFSSNDWNNRDDWNHGGNSNSSVGDVTSGDASNWNSTNTSVSVKNTTAPVAPLAPMQPMSTSSSDSDSHGHDNGGNNSLVLDVNYQNSDVTNTTTTDVTNSNTQNATSGNVTVSGNRQVGNVSSGDATNSNSTTTSVTVSNQQ